jgi:hypothetical protein
MPDPTARPQHPGKVSIDVTPGKGSIQIDDYDIGQFVTSMQLRFDAGKRRPVLMLDLLPSAVNVTGTGVEMRGDFRDFLIAHGWRPPE